MANSELPKLNCTSKQFDLAVEQISPVPQGKRKAGLFTLITLLKSCAKYLQGYNKEHEDVGEMPISHNWILPFIEDGTRNTRACWEPVPAIISDGDFEEGRCRSFSLDMGFVHEWALAGIDGPRVYRVHRAHTGEKKRTRKPSKLSSSSSKSEDIQQALEQLGKATHTIDVAPLEEAIDRLSRDVESAEVNGQLANVVNAYRWIQQQEISRDGTLVEVQQAFEALVSGRLQMKTGGVQGLMRAVKHKAYLGQDDVRNYDLKSCHTNALLHHVEQMQQTLGRKIDVSGYREYLRKGGKDYVVEATQGYITRDAAKEIEHALKAGAALPKSKAHAKVLREEGAEAVDDVVCTVFGDDPSHHAYAMVRCYYADYYDDIRKIRRITCGEWYEEAKRNGGRAGDALDLPSGSTFYKNKVKEGKNWKTQLMTALMQAYESQGVHALVHLQTNYDYEVMTVEFDGLIVRGRIPDAAIEAARKQTGFDRLELAQKPIATEEELQELFGHEPAPKPELQTPEPYTLPEEVNTEPQDEDEHPYDGSLSRVEEDQINEVFSECTGKQWALVVELANMLKDKGELKFNLSEVSGTKTEINALPFNLVEVEQKRRKTANGWRWQKAEIYETYEIYNIVKGFESGFIA